MEVTLEVSCCKYPRSNQLPQFWEDNREALLRYPFILVEIKQESFYLKKANHQSHWNKWYLKAMNITFLAISLQMGGLISFRKTGFVQSTGEAMVFFMKLMRNEVFHWPLLVGFSTDIWAKRIAASRALWPTPAVGPCPAPKSKWPAASSASRRRRKANSGASWCPETTGWSSRPTATSPSRGPSASAATNPPSSTSVCLAIRWLRTNELLLCDYLLIWPITIILIVSSDSDFSQFNQTWLAPLFMSSQDFINVLALWKEMLVNLNVIRFFVQELSRQWRGHCGPIDRRERSAEADVPPRSRPQVLQCLGVRQRRRRPPRPPRCASPTFEWPTLAFWSPFPPFASSPHDSPLVESSPVFHTCVRFWSFMATTSID